MNKLSDEEVDQIIELVKRGVRTSRIIELTGRSEATIARIRAEYGLTNKLTKLAEQAENEKERWLQRNWRWKAPEDQHISPPHKKKRKSNFRTPYNH